MRQATAPTPRGAQRDGDILPLSMWLFDNARTPVQNVSTDSTLPFDTLLQSDGAVELARRLAILLFLVRYES